MSGQFYVEASYWARWPKVLVMCKKTGNGVERRRYVPEGGTRDEWNERTREVQRKYSEASDKLNARLLEESKIPNLLAEIDGLKWEVEELKSLLVGFHHCAQQGKCWNCEYFAENDGCSESIWERYDALGIEVE